MSAQEIAGRTKTLQLKIGKCEMMTKMTTYIKVPFKRAIKHFKNSFPLAKLFISIAN